MRGKITSPPSILPPPNWRGLSLQIYGEDGERIFARPRDAISLLNSGLQADLNKSEMGRLIISQRDQNRFLVLQEIQSERDNFILAWQAALSDSILKASDQSLDILQQYRRLSLRPLSLPTQMLYVFLLLAIGILGITTLLAIWISRKITRSLDALVTGTREIGRGNLNYQIPEGSRDEVGEVTRRFNQMTSDLRGFQERTRYLEQMAAWQEIARRLAHEIKNPLTPIQLTIQEMVDQYKGDDQGYAALLQECHGIVTEEIENLRKLVREFSDFGRLPALALTSQPLNRLVSEMKSLYPHGDLILNLSENMPDLYLDADRIRRVLINLIENALQSGGEAVQITITSTHSDSIVQLRVEDNGPGIEAENLERIFQPYFTTKSEGAGLGLAITRKMIEEHGGTIAVDSKVGRGTHFTIRFPLSGSPGHLAESPLAKETEK